MAVQHPPDPHVHVPVRRVLALADPAVPVRVLGHQRQVQRARRPGVGVADLRVAELPQAARDVPVRLLLVVGGAVRYGSVRFGSVRFGSVRFGSVRFGSVWCGAVRCGAVREDVRVVER